MCTPPHGSGSDDPKLDYRKKPKDQPQVKQTTLMAFLLPSSKKCYTNIFYLTDVTVCTGLTKMRSTVGLTMFLQGIGYMIRLNWIRENVCAILIFRFVILQH